ncbi:MAG: SGNH/GDSL hydrolase family protein [bacterium]
MNCGRSRLSIALFAGAALCLAHCETSGGSGADATPDTDAVVVVGDGGVDATTGPVDAAPADAAPEPRPALYPTDRTHSPITPFVAARLADLLSVNPTSQRDVFMKVGDSISASDAFADCFAGTAVDLAAYGALQPTLDYFLNTPVGQTTSFDRDSDVVEVGRTASWAVDGSPSPLTSEMSASNPAAAVVMFGTNDIGWFGSDHVSTLRWYYDHFVELVDTLVAAGIVPILSTIPPRDDSASLDAWVPMLNAMIRGVAEGHQIPLVDYHRELLPLADHGLSADGVHPTAYYNGTAQACVFSPEGLQHGYNVRNLITLEALDRVRSAVLGGSTPPDLQAPQRVGLGTATAPYVIDGALYTHLANTADSTARNLSFYSGCGSGADESGPELLYEMTLAQPARVRAMVFDVGDVDVDIHLLDGSASEAGCLARGDTLVEMALSPGTYHFSLDTYVSGGVEWVGEFLFVVLVCEAGVVGCE